MIMDVNKAKFKSMYVKTKALPALVSRRQDLRRIEEVGHPTYQFSWNRASRFGPDMGIMVASVFQCLGRVSETN